MRDRARSAEACAQTVREHQTPVISGHSAGSHRLRAKGRALEAVRKGSSQDDVTGV